MRNIRLTLEFDGTDFKGWQRQSADRTVQATIEDAVADLFGCRVPVTGAGRTDAGVHALAYVCNFRVDTRLECGRVAAAVQARLPGDVVILRAEDAPAYFHSRFHASARRYVYAITAEPTAIWRRTRLHIRYGLDVNAMDAAAQHLVGTHDFTSFTPAANDVNPVCRVRESRVERNGDLVEVTMEADRFVHHMVRNVVGTLLEVGRGRIGPERILRILRTKDRSEAGPTAPAHGLAFVLARYPEGAGTDPPAAGEGG